MCREEKNLSDEELVRLVQGGDTEIFGLLIERYEPKMMRYAKRFLFDSESAKDLVQEVFIKSYVNINGFDLTKKFSPWLYRIAHNSFINEIGRKNRDRSLFFGADIFLPRLFSKDSAEKDLLDRELKEDLNACLANIALRYREVLVLYYFENLSYQEIADVLHIPVAAVGVRLSRARKAMRKIIDKN